MERRMSRAGLQQKKKTMWDMEPAADKSLARSTDTVLYRVHSEWRDVSFQAQASEADTAAYGEVLGQKKTVRESPEWRALDMGRMNITTVPPQLSRFGFLVELSLNKNFLQEIAPEICRLERLRVLDVSENMIKNIPPEICKLVALRSFVANDNMIRTLPPEMGGLWRLEKLVLDGNPLEDSLKTLYHERGATETVRYVREHLLITVEPPERVWHYIETAEKTLPHLTLFSHNILGNTFTSSQIYGYVPSWALEWERRKDLLLAEILHQYADIACLQEVETFHYDSFFLPALEKHCNYSGCFIPKTRSKTLHFADRHNVDGCATFFRKDKYRLLKTYYVEFNKLAKRKTSQCDDMYQRITTKQNVALILLLEETTGGNTFLCGNVHLHWDPECKDVKLVQSILFLEELERIRESTNPAFVVVLGDFNSLPDSGVYSLFATGHVDPAHPDFLGFKYNPYTQRGFNHNFGFKNTYSNAKELPFSCFSADFKGKIDYIWYSSRRLVVTGLLGPLSQEYMSKTVGLPNIYLPSDHIHLVAELSLKPGHAATPGATEEQT
ncbi:MAG: CCR4-NOT transcription complex subunit 6, CCR4 [Amphiamblys sp. WSBS2006]|nr:MAG: CCR4-NOT transcription complex subunit 6, CCR4 [Amphiamblys sp. WSBS2006]